MRQGIAAHTSSHAKFRPKAGTRSAPRRVLQMARNSAASMPAAKTEHIPKMMSRIRYARQAHRGASIGQKLAARLNESHFRSLQGSRRCGGVPRRAGRRKRSAGRPGAPNGLPQLPDSVMLVLVQHSLRGLLCQRLGVSTEDLDSPVGPSLPLAVSAQSWGEASSSDGGRRCVSFRVEFAIALSSGLRGRNRA